MEVAALTRLMQQQGIRRVRVISGDVAWCLEQAQRWQQQLAGEWIWVSDEAPQGASITCTPAAARNLLGREFQHAVFDAHRGFHAEAFAALAGTLRAGGWLQLIVPPWQHWPERPDSDSLRWSEQPAAIPTPHFIHHLQRSLSCHECLLHRQDSPWPQPAWPSRPAWHCQAPQQQQAILSQLLALPPAVAVLTAPRGRGKSALAGMLAQQRRCIITAPAKVATDVLASFAGEAFRFMAPDALLAAEAVTADWLIVDEAAAIPAPLLAQLVSRFPHVLLVTTVQGYEGTGRGFMLKFCASLPHVNYFTLDEPLRWARHDPLEALLNSSLLFSEPLPLVAQADWQCVPLDRHDWQRQPALMISLYQLLTSAHYRTSPLDLRRMMDAPGMRFIALRHQHQVAGALWLIEEGGLDAELAAQIWAGRRRPRGNLVAQSLAAHGDSPQAATLRSLRISRIAVEASLRQHGLGSRLLDAARQATNGSDFLSVSFGFTPALWRFWQQNGFELVRIGSHLEASSGCYTAMALLPLTPCAVEMTQRASQRLRRDWSLLRAEINIELEMTTVNEPEFSEADWREAAGFAFALRPFEVSLPALTRLLAQSSMPLPALRARITQRRSVNDILAALGLAGAKGAIRAWRQETASALYQCDAARAEEWQRRLEALQ